MTSSYQQDPHPALCPSDVCEGRQPKMELRDYFAGQALIGMRAHPANERPVDAAKWAYDVADAMLEARKTARERAEMEERANRYIREMREDGA